MAINLGHKVKWFKTLEAKKAGHSAMAVSRIWSAFGSKPQTPPRS
ncbi:hypothetical protein MRBBS_1173 [Marinobacter sp. BSs20148]|nr:hypothetical protein MRBBS_1173 [Marinobacter sp. BSs20148]